MTIKTNAEGKVIARISADIPGLENGYIMEYVPTVPQGKELYYNGTEFELRDDPSFTRKQEIYALKQELEAIQAWMDATDYYCNKIKRGNWKEDDPRWLNYLVEYDEKHERKEVIEVLLKGYMQGE